MVADKVAQQGSVLELLPVVLQCGHDVAHRSRGAVESSVDSIIERVVEKTVHRVVLVGPDVGGITVQNLSDGMHSRCADEIRPEVLSDVLDSIDSDRVKPVRGNERLDPGVECADNRWVFSVDIGEGNVLVAEPACLDLSLIRVVFDPAEAVDVSGGDVEWSVRGISLEVLCVCRCDVVNNL